MLLTSVMTLSASGSAGETVTLLDESGNVLGSFTPGNAFDTLMISSAGLETGSSCTVTGGSRTLYSGAVTDNAGGAAAPGYGNNGFMNNGFGDNGSGHGRNRRGW